MTLHSNDIQAFAIFLWQGLQFQEGISHTHFKNLACKLFSTKPKKGLRAFNVPKPTKTNDYNISNYH